MNSASINRCIQSLPEKIHIKRCNRKKALKPAEKRELVQYVQSEHDVSERFSSRLVGISRRVNNYVSVKNDDEIILSLRVLVEKYPGFGFWKLYHLLRNEGKTWN